MVARAGGASGVANASEGSVSCSRPGCLDQGRSAEAGALLQPVYDCFTEGFDTLDLRDARALLDSLTPDGAGRSDVLAGMPRPGLGSRR